MNAALKTAVEVMAQTEVTKHAPDTEPAADGVAIQPRSMFARPRLRPFRALQHSAFTTLFTSFTISHLGFGVSIISLQWIMADLTDNAPMMLGTLWFFMLLPMLVLSPIAGLVADRFNRKYVVITSQLCIAVVASVLAIITFLELLSPGLLFTLAFALGSGLSLNGPSNQAITANAVPARDLPSAISLNAATMNLSRAVGPGLAAPFLLRWGAAPGFAIYAVAALVTAALLTRIRVKTTPQLGNDIGWFARLSEGFVYARDRKPTLTILGLVAVTAIFGSSYPSLFPVFGREVQGSGDSGFILLSVCTGLGAFFGALMTGYREKPMSVRAAGTLLVALGLAIITFASLRSPALALVIAMGAGGLNFACMTVMNAMLQYTVHEDKRGRVMALYIVCWGGLIPIGVLSLGALGELLGTPLAVALFGGTCIALALPAVLRHDSARPLAPPE